MSLSRSCRPRAITVAARRVAAALLYGLLCAAAFSACADSGEDYARQVGADLVGRRVPPLQLTTIDGQTLDLAALRGHKAVYLKFWATWCVPCREQMPHFEGVQRNAGDDLQVVAVNIGFDDSVEQIQAYRREHGLTMPIVRDGDGRLGELFGLRVTPQHVIVGKDGRIAYVGHLADARLEAALAAARHALPAREEASPPLIAAGTGNALQPGAAVPAGTVSTLEQFAIPLTDPAARRDTVLAFVSPWCEGYFAKTRPLASQQCRVLREQLVAHGRDRRVRWIGIASGLWASEQDLRDYRNQHRIPVPLTLDRNGALFRAFGVRRVPAAIVVDARGRILRELDADALDRELADVLAAADDHRATVAVSATPATAPTARAARRAP